MFVVVRIAVALALSLVLVVPIGAVPKHQSQRHRHSKIIMAKLTFHDSRPNRNTCKGKRQRARMAAINRKKSPLMDHKLALSGIKDEKSGRIVLASLPPCVVSDVMGPGPRREKILHIDYYIDGKIPPEWQKFNNKICRFRILN